MWRRHYSSFYASEIETAFQLKNNISKGQAQLQLASVAQLSWMITIIALPTNRQGKYSKTTVNVLGQLKLGKPHYFNPLKHEQKIVNPHVNYVWSLNFVAASFMCGSFQAEGFFFLEYYCFYIYVCKVAHEVCVWVTLGTCSSPTQVLEDEHKTAFS